MSLSETIRNKYAQIKRERAERAGYNRILQEKAKQADRQAYAKEYEHQVRLKARRDAQAKFKPRPSPSYSGGTILGSQANSMGSILPSSNQKWDPTGGIFNQVSHAKTMKARTPKQPAWDVTGGVFGKKRKRGLF